MAKNMFSALPLVLKDRSGAAIVEAAVIAPLYFLLVLGTLGWGLVLWEVNSLQYAAEKSARCSILPRNLSNVRGCNNWSDVASNAIDWIPSISASSFSPTFTSESAPATTTRSFSSTRTSTVESYPVNCISISVTNEFLPNFASIPGILKQSFCRPAQ